MAAQDNKTESDSNDGGAKPAATGSSGSENNGQSSGKSLSLTKVEPKKTIAKDTEISLATILKVARTMINNLGFGGKEGTPHLEAFVSADITANNGKMDVSGLMSSVTENAKKALGDYVVQQQLFTAKNMPEASLFSFAPNVQQGGKQQSVATSLPA